MKKIENGLLIILEGGEGVGKTTQAKALVNHYTSQGYSAKYFREPGGNKLAEDIRNMILYNEMDSVTETLLFTAARSINIKENILPALQNGDIVILDRFVKSTIVYQGIFKNGDIDFINTCIEKVTKELFDCDGYSIEFTLLCEPEVAMERAAAEGHERNKNDILPIEDYKKINDGYKDLYNKSNYGIGCEIDTTHLTQEDVFIKLTKCIETILKGCGIYEE